MTASPYIYKYPKDLSGTNPTNQVVGELMKVFQVDDGAYIGIPGYAPFYTESLVVEDEDGNELTPHVDYKAIYMDEELSKKSPLEICAAIYITKQLPYHDVPGHEHKVKITYNTVGYPYTHMVGTLAYLLDILNHDMRSVQWGKIINLPHEFPSVHHLHSAGDFYGLDHMVFVLMEIRKAIVGVYNHNDPDNIPYTQQDRRMLQRALGLIDAAVTQVETLYANMNQFLEDMAAWYGEAAFADWLPGVMTLEGPTVLTDPVTVTYTFTGAPDGSTIRLESDINQWFDQTDGIAPDGEVYLAVAPIPNGRYPVAVYAEMPNGARTLKQYVSIEVNT